MASLPALLRAQAQPLRRPRLLLSHWRIRATHASWARVMPRPSRPSPSFLTAAAALVLTGALGSRCRQPRPSARPRPTGRRISARRQRAGDVVRSADGRPRRPAAPALRPERPAPRGWRTEPFSMVGVDLAGRRPRRRGAHPDGREAGRHWLPADPLADGRASDGQPAASDLLWVGRFRGCPGPDRAARRPAHLDLVLIDPGVACRATRRPTADDVHGAPARG